MQPNSWLGELGFHTVQLFSPTYSPLYIFYKTFWILPLKMLKRKTLLNWYPDLSNLGLSALTAILQAEPLEKFGEHINISISLQQVLLLGREFSLQHLKIWICASAQGPQVRVDETCHLHAGLPQHSIS